MKKTAFISIITAVIVLLVSCSTTARTPSYEERRQEFISAITTDRDLSEAEKIVDEKLKVMKSEADKQYTAIETYGIVNWNNGQSVHEGLLDFCRQLPKGGDLHVHDNTLVPITRYIEVLKKHGNVRICLEPGVNYGYLYPADYSPVPEGVVSLKEAMESGRFTERELVELLTASEEDGVAVGIWVSFENLFSMTLSLASDSELRTDLYEEGFRYACENNILLVESRVFFGTDDVDNLSLLECIRDAYYRVRKDYPDFRVRVIPVSGKNGFFPVEVGIESLRSAIRLSSIVKDEFDPEKTEDFIIGLDLVNEEDSSKSLQEYAPFLTSEEVAASGLKLYLHGGESLRMNNREVIDTYLIGAKRVGHGFNLYRYPELMERFAKEEIAVEVCPMSNYRLGYVADLRLHPALIYLRSGIPVVICSDDGAYLTQEPLVNDYYAAILCWNLSLADIKKITRNALIYSGLPQDQIDDLLAAWQKQWDSFIEEWSKD